jgi:hypothetical protein
VPKRKRQNQDDIDGGDIVKARNNKFPTRARIPIASSVTLKAFHHMAGVLRFSALERTSIGVLRLSEP